MNKKPHHLSSRDSVNNGIESVTSVLKKLPTEEQVEVIKNLPTDVQERYIQTIQISEMYSGPIPHPNMLREFNDIIPDGADRIMKMTENQSNHRQRMEDKVISAKNRDSLLGILFAGAIGLLGIGGTIFLMYSGQTVEGVLLGGGTLGSLVGVYLKGTNLDSEDLRDKSNKN